MNSKIKVPSGLSELLQNFTIAVLRNKPDNLVQYAHEYFQDLATGESDKVDQNFCNNVAKPNGNKVDNDENTEVHVRDKSTKRGRRQSVAAESYDPEQETKGEEKNVSYPKTDKQRQRLSEAIKDIFLFRSLDDEQRGKIIEAMREIDVKKGEIIIKQGDSGDDFYIIEKGRFDILVGNQKIGDYSDKGFFGELALMYNTPRAATIIATSVGIIWAMERVTFRKIVLKNAFLKRKMYESLLENVTMLDELSQYDRTNLADALYPVFYEDGERILEQGKEGTDMFFIEFGMVRVVREFADKTPPKEMSRLKKGEYFGEVSLLCKEPRLASVYAVGKTKLAVLDVQSFERLMGPCVILMQKNLPKYKKQLKEILGDKADKLFPNINNA